MKAAVALGVQLMKTVMAQGSCGIARQCRDPVMALRPRALCSSDVVVSASTLH